MKKVLQKTLFRLKALLLLVVMFVVGSSAWAQITFDLSKGTQTKDGVTVTAPNYDGSKGVELWGGTSGSGYTLTISSPETPIERVEFSGVVKYGNGYTIDMDSSEGGFEGTTTGSSINWVKTESVKSIIFTANKTGDYNTRNNIDFYVKTAVVYLEEAGNFVDFNYSSANGGEKGFYSLSSDALTFDAPVTVEKNLKIDGSNVTSATANGNVLNVNFSEINTPGIHTLTVPKGALRIGEDLNNEFSVTYTLVQDPNKLLANFNFNGAAIPYTTGGNPSTLTSGKNLAVGDVFESQGVTMTFNNVASAWSNSAQRLRLGQNTAFTIAAPEGYEITKVDFKTDANSIQLAWIKGLNTSNSTHYVWTGNEESLDFRASYDTWIQTIDVTCVKLVDVEYEVDIYKGTEMADEDWTVTVNGVDGTFKNMDTFTTGKKITASDVVAPHHDGYHDAEVSIEDWGGTMIINVTYEVFEPVNYTVDFSDNAPDGASVTIDGKKFTGDDTYSVAKDLDYYSVTAVDAPAGWYADYDYTAGNHTFTFDFKQYITYSVVVEGAPAGQGGVVYNWDTYGAGENVINAKTALTVGSVSAADVAGYAGTVSLDDHTFTVSYKKETIVIIPTSTASGVVGGINVSSQQENSEVNLYGDGSGYLKLTTTDLKMVKVQLVCKATSYTGSSNGGGANLYNLGQYVYVTDCDDPENTITSEGQNVEWTGSAKSITFTAPYDFHVTSIKVWVEEAEVVPRENVMILTVKEPNHEGNVNEITSTISFDTDVNTEGNHHGYDGSSTDVPDGVTMKDASGNSYTITAMRWWNNDSQVSISLEHGITTPGDYTLTIPEGVIPCVGNKANKEIVFEWTIAEPTTYTVTFADGAPAGASVTIDGNTYTESTTFPSKHELNENSANVKDVEGYEGSVAYDDSNKEFTITYTALPEIPYTINISPEDDENLKIRIYGKEYARGTHVFYEELAEESIEAPKYDGYYDNPSVTLNNAEHTITVVYTAFPTLAIGANARDNEGNYWTSFCFEKPFSLPEGYTPCIVTGVENGVLSVQEFESVNNETSVYYDFQNNGVERIGNGLYIEGNNYDISMTISGSTVFQSVNPGQGRIEGAGSVTISHPENISKVIVTPWGGGYGANVSLNGADPINVGTEPYTFEVNATSCTLGLTSNGNGVYIFGLEVVVGGEIIPVIPANTGILVKSNGSASKIPYTVYEEDVTTVDVSENILQASGSTGFQISGDSENFYYKLTLNAASEAGSAGFYWDKNSDGHSINVPAHKAYLMHAASPESASIYRYLIGGEEEGTLTAIDGVVETDDAPIYDLQGKRVVAPKAGVYVKNGKKFIVK